MKSSQQQPIPLFHKSGEVGRSKEIVMAKKIFIINVMKEEILNIIRAYNSFFITEAKHL